MIGGFRESPLRLNQGLGQVEVWNEQAIVDRADRLAREAVAIWTRPVLSDDVLREYEEGRTDTDYSIKDHPHLLRPERRSQFDALCAELSRLDPSVSIEFLKVRVAVRAESIFLDIVPQAARLVLVLNLPFSALRDERFIARDVTDIGHWGTGDVQVPFAPGDDLSYVMGLVRQAYEYQLGVV